MLSWAGLNAQVALFHDLTSSLSAWVKMEKYVLTSERLNVL